MKLDAFYALLVKEGELTNTDTEEISADNDKDDFAVDIEDRHTAIEVSHSFTNSDNYFLSYLLRTIM